MRKPTWIFAPIFTLAFLVPTLPSFASHSVNHDVAPELEVEIDNLSAIRKEADAHVCNPLRRADTFDPWGERLTASASSLPDLLRSVTDLLEIFRREKARLKPLQYLIDKNPNHPDN